MNILVQFKVVYISNSTFPVQTRKSVTHEQVIMCVNPPPRLSLSPRDLYPGLHDPFCNPCAETATGRACSSHRRTAGRKANSTSAS